MKFETTTKITQIIEIFDNDTKEKYFLIEKDGNWQTVSKEEYKKIIEE